MTQITYQDNQFELLDKESVLDCLLRNHQEPSHSCRSGVCQSCMMQVDSNSAAEGLCQSGLSPQKIDAGYFLPCQSFPKADLTIVDHPPDTTHTARVVEKKIFNSSVFSLTIEIPPSENTFSFHGGQFVNIIKDKECTRSYSIASATNSTPDCRHENSAQVIELHIKRYESGAFSEWAYSSLESGDTLTLQSPVGNCYYNDGFQAMPLQLFAMGTGLAPIVGVLKTALSREHKQPIRLVAGAKHSSDLYYLEELNKLANKYPHLSVTYTAQVFDDSEKVVSSKYDKINIEEANFYDLAVNTDNIDPQSQFNKNAAFFICGAESFVTKLRKKCFLAGASLSNIHADIFLASQPQ